MQVFQATCGRLKKEETEHGLYLRLKDGTRLPAAPAAQLPQKHYSSSASIDRGQPDLYGMENAARGGVDDWFIDDLPVRGIPYVPFVPLGGFTPLRSSALDEAAAEVEAMPMQVALAWLLQTAFDSVRESEIIPGPKATSDDIRDLARTASGSFGHAVGTCKMGTDKLAVSICCPFSPDSCSLASNIHLYPFPLIP